MNHAKLRASPSSASAGCFEAVRTHEKHMMPNADRCVVVAGVSSGRGSQLNTRTIREGRNALATTMPRTTTGSWQKKNRRGGHRRGRFCECRTNRSRISFRLSQLRSNVCQYVLPFWLVGASMPKLLINQTMSAITNNTTDIAPLNDYTASNLVHRRIPMKSQASS